MISLPKNLRLREPLLILVLCLLASIFFAATHAYTSAYDRHRAELGQQWYATGLAELRIGQPAAAIDAFQTALRYAPENWNYRFQLASALTAAKRTDEALGYYQTLWQSNPGNGPINLQLARLAAQKGDRGGAERYFNGAVFGIWENDAGENRREALMEMIDFYLQQNNYGAADSELIVLAANLPKNSTLHAKAASLFLRVNDNDRALGEFRDALALDPRNAATLRGAAQAAFRLGLYAESKSLLDRSLRIDPPNEEARNLLATTSAILSLDPFDRRIRLEERAARIVRGFQIAGDRLNACIAQLPAADFGDLPSKWMMLAPMVIEKKIRNDSDLSQQAMELTFLIEQQTSKVCGAPPPGPDTALLTIAQGQPKAQ